MPTVFVMGIKDQRGNAEALIKKIISSVDTLKVTADQVDVLFIEATSLASPPVVMVQVSMLDKPERRDQGFVNGLACTVKGRMEAVLGRGYRIKCTVGFVPVWATAGR